MIGFSYSNDERIPSLDITQPDTAVEIEVDHERKVVYVHIEGFTCLRICRTPSIKVTETGRASLAISIGSTRPDGSDGDADESGEPFVLKLGRGMISIPLKEEDRKDCPFDTDGDGNCGRPLCGYCGPLSRHP